MTYGVPYSFVPGTKAKADEVNANFIDILNKLEDTNTRIDDTNTKLDTSSSEMSDKIKDVSAKCADLDLSNISAKGKKLFDAKANASLLDGTWVNKYKSYIYDKSIGPNVRHNYTIPDYFPSDSNKYELLFSICGMTANQSNACTFIYLRTDALTNDIPVCRMIRSSGAEQNGNYGTLVVGSKRNLQVFNTENAIGTSKYTIRLHGYRKVR